MSLVRPGTQFAAMRESGIWPFTSFRCAAATRPESGVKRTRRGHRSTDAFDPNVWSGRASQEHFVDLGDSGLASMYPAFGWSDGAPGHHGYQRACELISGQASSEPFGSPVFAGAGKTDPPFRLILSQTSAGERLSGYVTTCSLHLAFAVQAGWALTSKLLPCARTLQAMRASLLARAIASTL